MRLQRLNHEHHGPDRHALPARVHVPRHSAAAARHARDGAAAARAHPLHHRRAQQLPAAPRAPLPAARRRLARRPRPQHDRRGARLPAHSRAARARAAPPQKELEPGRTAFPRFFHFGSHFCCTRMTSFFQYYFVS